MKYFRVFVFQTAWVDVLAAEPGEPRTPTIARFDLDEPMPGVLLGCFGTFAVADEFAESMEHEDFSGYRFGQAYGEVVDGSGMDHYEVPDLRLLIITGTPLIDDFAINEWGMLVVSERVFSRLSARDPFVRGYSRELGPDGAALKMKRPHGGLDEDSGRSLP